MKTLKNTHSLSNKAQLKAAMNHHLGKLPSTIFKDMPGQKNLLESFEFKAQTAPTDYFTQRGAFSWNTFTQQLLIDETKIPDNNPFSGDFKKLGDAVYSSLYLTHESLHIFLWEPFFTGKYKLKTHKQYVNYALCFEGLAFWYSDIWLTPKVRVKLPDGSFTFTKSTISSPYFHPDQALKALGVTDKHKALDLYMEGFTGYDTKRMLRSKNGYIQNLSHRVFEFYASTLKLTKDHFAILKRTGIFDEYWNRFCNLKNIPSLMEDELSLSLKKEAIPYEYTKRVFYEALPKIDRYSSASIHRVFQRRGIQTRAYILFAMRDLFSQNRVIRPNQGKVNSEKYLKLINTAIDRLEKIMAALCDSNLKASNEVLIDQSIHQFDEFYETTLRAAFKRDCLFMRNFHQLLPKGKNVGLIDPGECKEHKDILSRYLSTYTPLGKNTENFLKYTKKDWNTQTILGSQLTTYKNKKMTKKQIEKWVELYNQWMASPNLIWRWSKPLDIQSFKEGYLIELGYSYE